VEWKTRTPRKALRMMEHDLQELQDAQDDIGWDKFMFGNILDRRFGKWHGTNGNTGVISFITPRISSHKHNQ
jgi:hypothetical protein